MTPDPQTLLRTHCIQHTLAECVVTCACVVTHANCVCHKHSCVQTTLQRPTLFQDDSCPREGGKNHTHTNTHIGSNCGPISNCRPRPMKASQKIAQGEFLVVWCYCIIWQMPGLTQFKPKAGSPLTQGLTPAHNMQREPFQMVGLKVNTAHYNSGVHTTHPGDTPEAMDSGE